ncbi:MAG: hypothetical protein WC121_14190 [Candidatus Kapaibacterium sp.]
METLFIFNLILIFSSLLLLFATIGAARETKKAKHKIRLTKTVSMFASARNNLLKLVYENKIDPNSVFFKSVYHMNTAFMRRPEQYLQISKELLSSFGTQNNNPNVEKSSILVDFDKNSENYEAVLRVYAEFMNAVSHIAIEYSLPLRILMKISIGKDDELKHLNFLYNSIKGLDFLKKIAKEYEEKKQFEKYQTELKSSLNSNFKLA